MKRGIFLKIFTAMMLVSILGGAAIVIVTLFERAKETERSLVEEHLLLAKVTAEIIENDYLIDRIPFQVIKSITDSEDVHFAWIVKPDGEVFYANDPEVFGKRVDDPFVGSKEVVVRDTVHREFGHRMKLIVYPLYMLRRNEPWSLFLGVSLESLENEKRALLIKSLASFAGLMFLIGIVSFYIASGMTRPLRNLRQAAKEVGRGNLRYRTHLQTGDEIEEVGNTFNAMARDLEHRERELQYERDKIGAIVQNLSSGLIMHAEDGRVSLINSQAEKLLGCPSKGIVGRNIKDKLLQKSANISVVSQILSGGTNERKEFVIEKPEYRILQVTTVPLGMAEQKKKLYVTLLYDITHEREIDQMKSDFISIASHQLRTPLSVIKWVTKMILVEDLGPLNEEQKNYLERAYKSTERMVNLVNDLLNVSRIEEGKLIYAKDDVRIIELVKEVVGSFEILIAKNNLALAADFTSEDVVIQGDREKLQMAFFNLVDNAVKFTPRYGRITVTAHTKNDLAIITVSDTGIGINLKDQIHLFEKFFRAENARLVHTEGSGLGLFIVRNVIAQHGGVIEIHSEPQKGTTVVCKLPILKENRAS